MNTTPTPPAPGPGIPLPALPLARDSDRLSEELIAPSLDAGRDPRPGRAQRFDGWTPDRIRTFLATLAERAVVAEAARAAGMSVQSAYDLRRRAAGRAFHIAWNAALQLAGRRLQDAAIARAVNGSVELLVRDGVVVAERHRHDNRFTLAMLTHLSRQAESNDAEVMDARLVAQEFDEFLEIAAAGGEGADAFIAARRKAQRLTKGREAQLLRRLDSYRETGAGMPEGAEPPHEDDEEDPAASMLDALYGDDEDEEADYEDEAEREDEPPARPFTTLRADPLPENE